MASDSAWNLRTSSSFITIDAADIVFALTRDPSRNICSVVILSAIFIKCVTSISSGASTSTCPNVRRPSSVVPVGTSMTPYAPSWALRVTHWRADSTCSFTTTTNLPTCPPLQVRRAFSAGIVISSISAPSSTSSRERLWLKSSVLLWSLFTCCLSAESAVSSSPAWHASGTTATTRGSLP